MRRGVVGYVLVLVAGLVVSVLPPSRLTSDPWVLVVAHRVLALVGLGLLAWAVPRLSRSSGVDGATAFALVLASPLVLAHGVAGAQNDLLIAPPSRDFSRPPADLRVGVVTPRQQCAFFLASQGTPGVIVEHGDTDAMFTSPQDQRTADYVTGRFG